jgi:beta-xylosidase
MASDSVFTFENPVIRGFNPDPTICVVPATSTSPAQYFLSTSTFEYFPGAAIYHSTDLISWKLIGHALNRRSQIEMRTVEPGAGSWASTLRYRAIEKRWYLTNGIFQRYRPFADERIFPRGFYVYTDNIWDDNAWSDPVYFDNPGFDQDLFWDDDGKVYLSTTVRMAKRTPGLELKDLAIHVSEIDLPTGRTLTPPKVIHDSPFGIAEGSHIIRKGDYYYLFSAEGGTEKGHQEWVFRSKEGPYGPWEGQGKELWYNGPDEEVQRTGHCDVFEDGTGSWWAVLLGVRPVKDQGGKWLEPQLGRETFLVRVDWEYDWPIFNCGNNVTLTTIGRQPVERLAAVNTNGIRWKADLTRHDLELGWYSKSTSIPFHVDNLRKGNRINLNVFSKRHTAQKVLFSN